MGKVKQQKSGNYVKIQNDILAKKKNELHPMAKLVYAAILIFTYSKNKSRGVGKNSAEITRRTLSLHLDIEKSTVTKYISLLRKEKLIEVEHRFNASSIYTIKDRVEKGDRNYTELLHSFVLHRVFDHRQKIFLVSVASHILYKKNYLPTILYTYDKMEEVTGLSKRFIADQVRGLCKLERNGVSFMEKLKGGGWHFNIETILSISNEELLSTISERQFEVQRANNLDNKRK